MEPWRGWTARTAGARWRLIRQEMCRGPAAGSLPVSYLSCSGFSTLLGTELVLVLTIPGQNYAGADGKAAQAIILASLEFARPFHISNLNPLEGMGSQMMPMNVWVNPAYWPFAFFDRQVASEVSGLVALACYALACYGMARCFDVPRLPSIAAAQLSLMLFGSAALALGFAVVYVSIPGLAVVYAPHMLAFGLLARLSPERPQVFVVGAALFALLAYSLYCDPLWTLVSGIAWIVPFAVVTFSPLRRETILVRCAVLGGSLAVLLLSGALEYAYSLSQYTARVQFPDLLRRPPDAVFASAVVSSKYAKYFYYACVLGWVLGMGLLRGRPRTLVLAASISAVALLAYAAAFLLWAGTGRCRCRSTSSTPSSRCSGRRPSLVIGVGCKHSSRAVCFLSPFPRLPATPLPLTPSLSLHGRTASRPRPGYRWALNRIGNRFSALRLRIPVLLSKQSAAMMAIVAMGAALIIPAVAVGTVVKYPKWKVKYWQENWPEQPELDQFLATEIGLRSDRRFRGTVLFYTNQYDEFLTIDSLWAAGVPTANEYSQLVTPQSIYFINQLFHQPLTFELNWFRPWSGDGNFPLLFKTLRALGVRYVAGYERFAAAEAAHLPSTTLPRRPLAGPPGGWLVYELPDANVGNYSPTRVMTAESATEILNNLRSSTFEYRDQVVLSTAISQALTPARNVRMSIVRGGLHVSAQSDGTSLLLLPQQFSHCLRAHDDRVRLVRANLIMTGLIFSGKVDTDISFDYGILSPRCRRADFADLKQLQIKLASP